MNTFYKSSPIATNVATSIQQLATISDIQRQCKIPREKTQRFERDRLNDFNSWWAKKAERIMLCRYSSRLLRATRAVHPFANHGKPFWNCPMAWIVVAYAHGLERAIGSKCSKDEERGKRNELELEQDVQCASAHRHFGTSAYGQQSCVPLTKKQRCTHQHVEGLQ